MFCGLVQPRPPAISAEHRAGTGHVPTSCGPCHPPVSADAAGIEGDARRQTPSASPFLPPLYSNTMNRGGGSSLPLVTERNGPCPVFDRLCGPSQSSLAVRATSRASSLRRPGVSAYGDWPADCRYLVNSMVRHRHWFLSAASCGLWPQPRHARARAGGQVSAWCWCPGFIAKR